MCTKCVRCSVYTRVVMMPNSFSFSIFVSSFITWFGFVSHLLCPSLFSFVSSSLVIFGISFHSLSFYHHMHIAHTFVKVRRWRKSILDLKVVCVIILVPFIIWLHCNNRHATWHIILKKRTKRQFQVRFHHCGSMERKNDNNSVCVPFNNATVYLWIVTTLCWSSAEEHCCSHLRLDIHFI